MTVRDDDHHVSLMLARQVLGLERYESDLAHRPAADITSAHAEIEIRLQSMVRGMCQRVWVDSAAIATMVEAEIKRAASMPVLEQVVADAVAAELARARSEITRIVQKKIQDAVDRAIDERLGKGPAVLAKKITDHMWEKAFSQVKRKSDIYGRAPARRKRR